MASAFQGSAFQAGAFQAAGTGRLTDTTILQKPIDCVLAGQQPYKYRDSEYEIPAYRRTHKTAVSKTGVARLRGGAPSFTSKTSSRGYD